MKRLAAFVLLLAGIGSAYASDGDAERLRAWRAGEKVTEEAVAEYGIDRCFASSETDDENEESPALQQRKRTFFRKFHLTFYYLCRK